MRTAGTILIIIGTFFIALPIAMLDPQTLATVAIPAGIILGLGFGMVCS